MTGRLEACIRLANKVGIRNKVVLDIGCSFGWFCKIALKEKAKQVYAIEPDERKVQLAKKMAPSAIINKGIAGELNFDKNKFDLVTLFDVIEHVPRNSEPKVFSEICRVLKPRGCLIISTPFQNFFSNIVDPAWYFGHRHYSKAKLAGLLKREGFKVIYTATQGGLWEIVAMWVLYFTKWVLRIKMPFEEWFDIKRRKEYRMSGIVTLQVIAQKI